MNKLQILILKLLINANMFIVKCVEWRPIFQILSNVKDFAGTPANFYMSGNATYNDLLNDQMYADRILNDPTNNTGNTYRSLVRCHCFFCFFFVACSCFVRLTVSTKNTPKSFYAHFRKNRWEKNASTYKKTHVICLTAKTFGHEI